ncbi:MAG: DUF2079 domain-containing protein [Candidatus Rokubacteria bacterium]|nr:DUF2079 domain-containing protein [Candidatus Rokubacteria bacterium]
MTSARLLDLLALSLGAGLLGALLFPWWRPEEIVLAILGVVSLRLLVRPWTIPAWRPRRVVAVGVATYGLLFSFVTVTRHNTFLTHALDLGYYVQLVWNLAGGRGPRVSLPEMHAWGDHFSPIMYLFVPAFWVAPGAVALLVAQSVLLALGAVAVFGIARRRLGDERPAAAFAVLYLVNPSLHGINVRDFHAAALVIPLLLAAVWAVEAERPLWACGAAGLALLCREDAAIAVVGLGLWVALARRLWFWGAGMAAGALGILLVEVRWLIPGYRGEAYSHLWRYDHLGRSLPEILSTVLLHPIRTVTRLATLQRLVYLGALVAPLGLLPLAAPLAAVGALPGLAQNLLSRDPVLFHHRTQYQAFVLPFLFVAAVAGYARLAARRPGRLPAAVLVVAMVASLALASRTANQLAVYRFWPTPEQRAAHRLLAKVPAGAAVSAQDPYVPHLAMRPLVFVFPMGLEKSDHVLVNATTYPWRSLPGATMVREERTVRIRLSLGAPDYRYVVVAEDGPHLLLRRR